MNSYSLCIQTIIYEDEPSNFYIFKADDLDDDNMTRKVKGNFYALTPRRGLELEVEGEYRDTDYGPTLVARRSEPILETESGLRNYLISSINDLEPLYAHKLINDFGMEAVEMLRDDDDALYDVDYLEDFEVTNYVNQLDFHESFSDAIKDLVSFGIPSHLVKDVYLALEGGTIDDLYDDPYLLMRVDELPFSKIDNIAIEIGIDPNDDRRIASCIEYLLSRAERSGNLFLRRESVEWKIGDLPSSIGITSFDGNLDSSDIDRALDVLKDRGRVVVDDDRLYLSHNYRIEHGTASKLSDMIGSYDLGMDTDQFIDHYEDVHHISLSDKQKESIRALNDHKVVLVTGPPGTGKTTSVKALVRLFQQADKEFDLVCPTGIAAKKLGTVVGEEAKTIHRLLGYDGNSWDYDRLNKYQTDAIIVDESSMMDQDLLYRLVSSLKDDTALVFVGDEAQLPSVGAGHVLREMIRSESIKHVHLDKIFRQGQASDIIINAHRINEGRDLMYRDPSDADTDFRFIQEPDEERIIEGVLHLTKELFDHEKDHTFQVLSPTYKTPIGVDRLNREIKSVLNPPSDDKMEHRISDKKFREDDRIIVTENDYEKGVFNGEQGKVHWIKRKDSKIRAKIFDDDRDKIVDFSFSEAERMLSLCYAMTCHKAQGQEWDHVIMPVHMKFDFQLQRNLLYTAVTRARDKVFLLGQKQAVQKAIQNDRVEHRNTVFAERIRSCLNQS